MHFDEVIGRQNILDQPLDWRQVIQVIGVDQW
jgi:hypothetical protein